MVYQSLEGAWRMKLGDRPEVSGHVPGSVYSILLENEAIPDPFDRDNELQALPLMDMDAEFSCSFTADEALFDADQILLRCEGLDTICTVFLNGVQVGEADNFYRTWEFDVENALRHGENLLTVRIASPTRYIAEKDDQRHVGYGTDAMRGFPHIRKPHCMFGWDWGPRLPDMGIWKDIALIGVIDSRISDVRIHQQHAEGQVQLTVDVRQTGQADVQIALTAPDGAISSIPNGTPIVIEHPQLWWPHGYGAQPLYTLTVSLVSGGRTVDSQVRRIGLREMTISHEKDQWGEEFCHKVNGVKIFAMGADYIPEDNIFARITPQRTRKLLEQCIAANFNCLRVWGGGYYPRDDFYDACDELGIVIWQDMMFACANFPLDYEFEENITQEITENVRRIRHHACLGLWCGNNEMEQFEVTGDFESDDIARAIYIRMYEHIIPHILRREDPDTFYWPSSPSSGGSFVDPNAANRGDVHFWEVGNGQEPFDVYRKHLFRYVSEFGFESLPTYRTIQSFTRPEDRNMFSRVMEMHQRKGNANGLILHAITRMYLYPQSLEMLTYASQLLQAEAIRYGVEHWRRHRGYCMGTIYWQLNDIWPVASWASIDYYGRWKALHYAAKRFFAPVMISCEEVGELSNRVSIVSEPSEIETSIRLNVANETMREIQGQAVWYLRNAAGEILDQHAETVTVPALSTHWCDKKVFENIDVSDCYVQYAFIQDGQVVSDGSVLFTPPKYFRFVDPQITVRREGDTLYVRAAHFARYVEIYSPDSDLQLSDNYFDLHGDERAIKLLSGDPKEIKARSVFDIGAFD